MSRSTAIARYWRQVHAVERMTGTSSAIARRAVAALRDDRGWTTAAETARHPIVVQRTVDAIEAEEEAEPPDNPYRDLRDWIDAWDAYDGDYDYIEVETNADY